MIKIVDGDLLQANVPLIAHQTNCLGVMGAGIARSIKNKWTDVYTQYGCFVNPTLQKYENNWKSKCVY